MKRTNDLQAMDLDTRAEPIVRKFLEQLFRVENKRLMRLALNLLPQQVDCQTTKPALSAT